MFVVCIQSDSDVVKVKYSLQRQAHSSVPLGALVHEVRRVNHDGPGVENFHLLYNPAGSSTTRHVVSYLLQLGFDSLVYP